MKNFRCYNEKLSPFIFYSSGSSTHTGIFLKSFQEYGNLQYIYVFSNKNLYDHPSIRDTEFSQPAPFYMLLHILAISKYLKYGIKSTIGITGLHRRAQSLRKIAQKHGVKFIYCHQLTGPGIVSYLSQIPFIVTTWGSDINKIRFLPELKELSRRTLHNASFIHALSTRQKKILVEEGIPPSKIFVQHFGVNVEDFYPKKLKEDIKKELGFTGNKVIFAPRGHSSLYRPELLLNIISKIHEEIPNLKVIITGNYPTTPAFKQKTKEKGLNDTVIFVGFVSRRKYIQYNQMADIYLQTPEIDGVSVAVMESLASGTPVISSDVGDSPTNIKHGYNGYLIQGADIETYSTYIIELLEDKDKRQRMQKQALIWANEHTRRQDAMMNIISKLKSISEML